MTEVAFIGTEFVQTEPNTELIAIQNDNPMSRFPIRPTLMKNCLENICINLFKTMRWYPSFAFTMFWVYALYSKADRKIYVGFTSNIEARIRSHNLIAKRGWTIKYRPWILVHTERFETKVQAMKREKELKSSRGRTFIWELIKQRDQL